MRRADAIAWWRAVDLQQPLARQLTLLLDGGPAAGVLDAGPTAAEAAKRAARTLVDVAVSPQRHAAGARRLASEA